jgi:hypothetical protein
MTVSTTPETAESPATRESLRRQLGYRPPSVTLELNAGLAKLKVELGEFVSLMRSLVGAVKRDEIRLALKDMISEVRRTFDTLIDVMTPLYELDTASKFKASFGARRAAFKNTYLKSDGAVRTRCGVIADQMDVLVKKRGWLGAVPGARRSYERLKSLCSNWLLHDDSLVYEMKNFLDSVNKILDQIARRQRRSPSEAFLELQDVLGQIEGDVQQLKTKLEDLDRLSSSF